MRKAGQFGSIIEQQIVAILEGDGLTLCEQLSQKLRLHSLLCYLLNCCCGDFSSIFPSH
jgi:hypothetical protein